jgi:NDP-sugar pyrophosphorylase family protein
MKAGIFAAGMGSRFREAGCTVPKPLVKLQDRPLVRHVLDNLFRADIESVDILLNKESVFDAVESYLLDVPEAGRIRTWRKTTTSSYESFCYIMDRLGDPPFLITTVDAIFPLEDLRDFLRIDAYPPSCMLALAVTDLVHDETPLWVDCTPEGRVQRMGASASQKRYATAGVYLVLGDVRPFGGGKAFGALREFLGLLVQEGASVWAKRFPIAFDIDCPDDLRAAESVLQTHGQVH